MRETNFIQKNKQKWQDFELVLEGQYQDPDKLSDLFIQITDDLSYARTFYPNRSVRVYLNGLAQQIFFKIYKSRRSPLKRLGYFWLEELPQLVYEARREFLLAFAVFAIAFLIGVFSSAMDKEFARVILGDSYVDMTIANIESGDPMAVYKQRGKFGMSLGITANNLWVAFLTFAMGIFYAIGSLVILIQNGVMVGVFQHFFIEKGLFWESFLTIWIHGTLEISAIIIAGAAGITMGKGLAFPGTYTRAQAFQRSARRGLKIMVGIAPIIILAGFIEGYLTRHTETPDFIRGLFIAICLLFVVVYFVWYPYIRVRTGLAKPIAEAPVPPSRQGSIDFNAVKPASVIFGDTFNFYTRHLSAIAMLAVVGAVIFTTSAWIWFHFDLTDKFTVSQQLFGTLRALPAFFAWPLSALLAFTLSFTITVINARLHQEYQPELHYSWRQWLTSFVKNIVAMSALPLCWLLDQSYAFYLAWALLPVLILWSYVMQSASVGPLRGLMSVWGMLQQQLSQSVGLLLIISFVGLLFFVLTDTMVFWFFLELVSWLVYLDANTMRQVSAFIVTFTVVFILQMAFSLFVISFGLFYYTLREIAEATHLRARIQQMQIAKRIRGLEQEG